MANRVYKGIFWSILLLILVISFYISQKLSFSYRHSVLAVVSSTDFTIQVAKYDKNHIKKHQKDEIPKQCARFHGNQVDVTKIAQASLASGTIAPVSDVAHGPLVYLRIFQTTTLQQKRQAHIKRGCEANRLIQNYSSRSFFGKLNNNIALYDPQGFLYCRIQKVGSTFLQKTMNKAFAGIKFMSLRGNTMLVNRSRDFIDCLPKASKFMFVREPYGRAMSGYVDKLFAPNPVFWSSYGRHIVRTIRLNASQLSLRCGHDVTFPEFMKYVNIAQTSLKYRDRHFFPMYEHCFPCDIKYDFIGKMETFRDDVTKLFDAFESTFSVGMTFNDFEKESDLGTATNHINLLFLFRRRTSSCEPFHKSLLRLWRDLQIRGVIPIDVNMPFDPEEANTITKRRVTDVVTSVIRNVTNRKKLKEQRHEAKTEAFSLLATEILQEYRHLYHLDFELFDYPKEPTFMKKRISSAKNLKYFNIL